MTRMVLTNAVYFQGKWKQQFDKKNTREDDFEIEPGKAVKVSMMNQKMNIRLAYTPEFTLLEMPYQGDRWRMVCLLPEKRHNLKGVEGMLTGKVLDDAIAKLQPHENPVQLPKFKFGFDCKLRDQLGAMGMPRAFALDGAEFPGISGEQLSIENVIHQAKIEVDEEGTVAAAATAVTIVAVSAPKVFRFDQPFLVMLRDNATGTILFMGRVTDPR
jgi:serpin B